MPGCTGDRRPGALGRGPGHFASHVRGKRRRERVASPSLLAGKLVDPEGEPLVASRAVRGTPATATYVGRGLADGSASHGSRVPALELEAAVCRRW